MFSIRMFSEEGRKSFRALPIVEGEKHKFLRFHIMRRFFNKKDGKVINGKIFTVGHGGENILGSVRKTRHNF